jgi:transglutaminase-like putative cysteine protease
VADLLSAYSTLLAGERTYEVRHRTTYTYSTPVTDAYSITNLLPRDTPCQRVLSAQVVSEPEADELDERLDVFGNRVVQLGLHRPHDRFEVVGRSEVTVDPVRIPPPGPPWEEVVAACRTVRGADAVDVGAFLARTPAASASASGEELDRMFDDDFLPTRPLVDVASAVCTRIFSTFSFDPTSTDVSTPLDDVVANRRGVCQDFAHLALAVLRRRGLAARYVSGYIETDPPPGEPKSIGADASHAWCSVWVPGLGWVDLDPTNDQLPVTRHVTVAWGRDYRDVAPVRGVVIGPSAAQVLDVGVDVHRI